MIVSFFLYEHSLRRRFIRYSQASVEHISAVHVLPRETVRIPTGNRALLVFPSPLAVAFNKQQHAGI